MMSSPQLWRVVLAPSGLSADDAYASPDSHGSYGELMDAIDRVLRDVEAEDAGGSQSA